MVVGSNLAKLFLQTEIKYSSYLTQTTLYSMYFEPITEVEVTDLILSLDVSKPSGHDDISPLIVKDCCSILCKPLVYLYNLSIEQGVVPEDFKIAKVYQYLRKEIPSFPLIIDQFHHSAYFTSSLKN